MSAGILVVQATVGQQKYSYCAMPGECASDARRRAQLKKGPPSGHVVNAASQIMTVNSHIVLPRICMKYQNMLTELTSSHGTIQS